MKKQKKPKDIEKLANEEPPRKKSIYDNSNYESFKEYKPSFAENIIDFGLLAVIMGSGAAFGIYELIRYYNS